MRWFSWIALALIALYLYLAFGVPHRQAEQRSTINHAVMP